MPLMFWVLITGQRKHQSHQPETGTTGNRAPATRTGAPEKGREGRTTKTGYVSRQFDDMRRKAVNGRSDYLVAKGVGDFTFPCCPMDLCCWRWWINPAQSPQQHRLLPHMVKKTPDRFSKAGGISRLKRTRNNTEHLNRRRAGNGIICPFNSSRGADSGGN